MTLPELEALGCYMNAGFIDYYDGSAHQRLGQMTTGGDVILTPEGGALAASLIAPTIKKLKAKKGIEAPPRGEDAMLSELDSLLQP